MKALHSLSLTVAPEAEDAAAELLLRLTGETAVVTHSRVTGLSSAAVFLSVPDARLTELRAAAKAGLSTIAACGLDIRPGRLSCRRVKPQDWRESWKRHFRPLAIGRSLLVRPSWSRRRPVPGQVELVLDPGMSFGTGQHPTTEFCLRELVRLRPKTAEPSKLKQARVRKPALPSKPGLLDVGTGSGILALAAAKLGYRPVVAFDFDPEAVVVARNNARHNRVTTQVTLGRRDVARLALHPTRRYAVVCANLTADLLQRHADRLVAQLAESGHLVLAGILAEEFATVRRAFESRGLRCVRTLRRREWQSGSFLALSPRRPNLAP